MMFTETAIKGVYIIGFFHAEDNRGEFVKTVQRSVFEENGLNCDFRESFYSVNHRGVIRGMHFQLPPHDHEKVVYCTAGRLIDVILDIRKDSPTYGEHLGIELNPDAYYGIYLPKGVAHGFEVLTDHTVMTYLTSTEHYPAGDSGIRWDSFGYNWQTQNPVISDRDSHFQVFQEFNTPF